MSDATLPAPLCSIEGCTSEPESYLTVKSGRKYLATCRMHRSRIARHGDPHDPGRPTGQNTPRHASLMERIAYHGYVERQVREGMTPCHEWQSATCDGYPKVGWNRRVYDVHRAVLIDKLGYDLPREVHARHRCDNPPCINPDHLVPGEAKLNAADAVRRGRVANGERVATHKLTDDEVDEIRARYTGARGEQRDLAREYGVSSGHISMIVNHQTRKLPTHRAAVEEDRALGVPSPLVEGSRAGDRLRGVLREGRSGIRAARGRRSRSGGSGEADRPEDGADACA